VGALVDAAIAPSKQKQLHLTVRRVLAEAPRMDKVISKSGSCWVKYPPELLALAWIILDVSTDKVRQSEAPTLLTLSRDVVGKNRSKLERARRGWFKRVGGNQLRSDTVAFWQKNIHHFVQDPSHCDYNVCVTWLSATHELDETRAEALLSSGHMLASGTYGRR